MRIGRIGARVVLKEGDVQHEVLGTITGGWATLCGLAALRSEGARLTDGGVWKYCRRCSEAKGKLN